MYEFKRLFSFKRSVKRIIEPIIDDKLYAVAFKIDNIFFKIQEDIVNDQSFR
jgi:hypothetical protein